MNRAPHMLTSQQRADILLAEHQAARAKRVRRPRLCEDCQQNPADPPGRLCPGCEAYREHTGAI